MKFEITGAKKGSFYLLLLKSTTYLVGFFVMIFIVRRLSIHDYGIYNLLYAFLGYVGLISSLGLPSVFQRFIPDFCRHGKHYETKFLIFNGLIIRILVSIVLIVFILVLSHPISVIFKIENWTGYFSIFSLGIVFYLASELLNFSLASLFLHKFFLISNVIFSIIRGVIIIAVLSYHRNLRGLIIGEVISLFVLLSLLLYFFISKYYLKVESEKASIFPKKRVLNYCRNSYLNEIGITLYDTSTGIFIIGAFLNPVTVGIYAFAAQFLGQVSKFFPHMVIQEVVRPFFFARFATDYDKNVLNRMGNFLIKIIASYTIPLCVVMPIIGGDIIDLIFDRRYVGSLPIMIVLTVFRMLHSFQFALILIIQAIEEVQIITRSMIFALLGAVFSIIIIPHAGSIGVASITTAAILVQNIMLYFYLNKKIAFKIQYKSMLAILLNAIIVMLLIFLVHPLIVDILVFIIVLFGGIIVYVILTIVFNDFNDYDIRLINSMLGRTIFKGRVKDEND